MITKDARAIDITFGKVVSHVDAEIKECPACHSETKGRLPEDMQDLLHYDADIKAFILNLFMAQMVSLSRINLKKSIARGV